jgi:hypothetical protein
VHRKPDYLQFKPYRAIVASPIKQRKIGGRFFSALPKWALALLLLLGGTITVLGWRLIVSVFRQ